MIRSLLLALLMAPFPLSAQSAKFQKAPEGVIYSESRPVYVEEPIEAERPVSQSAPQPVAVLRGLDKVSGRVTDINATVGETTRYGRLSITVADCRAEPEEEGDDAYAYLRVSDAKRGNEEVFAGWMFASSPALSAMDHQRYDLWVLSCATS
ncbi:MAG: DUF2155 domain-containing protein [Pseudomonadota bacterium]